MSTPSLPVKIRIAAIGLIALLLLATGMVIWLGRQQVENAAYRDVSNLSDALALQVRNNFGAIDAALLTISKSLDAEQMHDPVEIRAIYELLAAAAQGLPQLFHLIIFGPDGRLLHSSLTPTPELLDFSDTAVFRGHRDNPHGELVVSPPAKGRMGPNRGQWTIHVSRPLVARDGSFAGVVLAALSVEKIQDSLEIVDVGDEGVVSLFHANGIGIARQPAMEGFVGTSFAGGMLFGQFLKRASRGTFENAYPTDGVARITAYQRIEDLPLVFLVGLSKSEVLADWKTRSAFEALLALFLATTVFGGAEVLRRNIHREQARDRVRLATLQAVADASIELTATNEISRLMQRATELARTLIPSHQSVISLTADQNWAQSIRAVSLSDKYAAWRSYTEKPDGSGIYHLICERNRPMRMTQAELEAHVAWKGFGAAKDRHPPMRGWLAAPLTGQSGDNVGVLQLSDREGGDYTAEDEAILVQLADVISVCIENAQLIERSREAAASAQQARDRVETVLSSISDAFYVLNNDFCFTYLNDRAVRLLQRRREDLLGKNVWEEFPEARETAIYSQYQSAKESGEKADFEFYYPPLKTWFEVHAFPYEAGLSVYFRDISERVETEERLRQSQKLEAIGQLTGGVAHDFNNLLTVILGNAEIMSDYLRGDGTLEPLVQMTKTAAERAAELTQRLLAFSRRQPLAPTDIDINALVRSIENLLRRALGEQIAIRIVEGKGLWQATVDAPQLENALLNLAINARDAMPSGGSLTIETTNVHVDADQLGASDELVPGHYVMISVSDTGEGISKEILPRVVEPFFTTKEVGKGSGLGLSMVYGFIKQSGGQLKIYSELQEGTTVRLYLPRAAGASGAASTERDAAAPPRGNEIVLLVEDDDMVRSHVKAQLRNLGYAVLEASDAKSALAQFETAEHIDVLLTDIIMPGGVNGRMLAEQLRSAAPHLKVLYMSGYTEDVITHRGRLDPGVLLLNKPFRKQELARKLRQAIDAGS